MWTAPRRFKDVLLVVQLVDFILDRFSPIGTGQSELLRNVLSLEYEAFKRAPPFQPNIEQHNTPVGHTSNEQVIVVAFLFIYMYIYRYI